MKCCWMLHESIDTRSPACRLTEVSVLQFVIDEGSLGHEAGARRVAGVDWDFNAYAGLYTPFENDKLIAQTILKAQGLERLSCPLVLEGGSIHVDGEG